MNNFENLQLQFDQLPSIEQIDFVKVNGRYKKLLQLSQAILFAIVSVIAILLFVLVEKLNTKFSAMIVVATVLLALFGLGLLYIQLSFSYRSYAIRQKDILYKHGWLIQKTHAVAYAKIQHCAVIQSFLAKKFNLANLKIYTAAGFGYDITIKGITLPEAEQLKDFILQYSKQ